MLLYIILYTAETRETVFHENRDRNRRDLSLFIFYF